MFWSYREDWWLAGIALACKRSCVQAILRASALACKHSCVQALVRASTSRVPPLLGVLLGRTASRLSACGSGDNPHVGIVGVALHKTRPISIIKDTNGCSFRLDVSVLASAGATHARLYRVTSLMRNRAPQGPYRRPLHRAL